MASVPARALDDPQPAGGVVTAANNPGAGDGRSGGWRQGVLADLTGPYPRPRPGPVSRLIGGPSGAGHRSRSRARVHRDPEQRRDAAAARDARARHGGPSGALGGAQHGTGVRAADVAPAFRRVRGSRRRTAEASDMAAHVDVQLIEGLGLPYAPGRKRVCWTPPWIRSSTPRGRDLLRCFPARRCCPSSTNFRSSSSPISSTAYASTARSPPIRSSGSR